MAITSKPKSSTAPTQEQAQIEKFINDAPDGNKAEKRGVKKGQREQITVTFDTAIIAQLDDLAVHEGVSRAALIRMAVRQLLDKGTKVGG
ncbi:MULTISPECIES: CopG family transcriptional regulator [Pantoea]|uniref:ribbon-helix-helix domain-containing protein n=1 Tax=Pantoea TaxID=53335 RepID=UPI00123284E7|nr:MULTISPECIES: CopG family transcriptional regulator [Pantoea]KAA6093711.1 CopG family transcriptional regulator [Pantoea sp. B_9]KAA6106161.1 CopG family transcriptional regulator [Pantoea sp. B_10]KAA8669021.1 CopG family transcriptional regulator [Pantoea dispersa]